MDWMTCQDALFLQSSSINEQNHSQNPNKLFCLKKRCGGYKFRKAKQKQLDFSLTTKL
jgi:hypothetical protein